jgi:hypothetical protein
MLEAFAGRAGPQAATVRAQSGSVPRVLEGHMPSRRQLPLLARAARCVRLRLQAQAARVQIAAEHAAGAAGSARRRAARTGRQLCCSTHGSRALQAIVCAAQSHPVPRSGRPPESRGSDHRPGVTLTCMSIPLMYYSLNVCCIQHSCESDAAPRPMSLNVQLLLARRRRIPLSPPACWTCMME